MSRTPKTLTRLCVAGVAVATVGAGAPLLLASPAQAADATQLSISPNPGRAAAGTCQVFTVTATDANGNPATFATATPTLQLEANENPAATNQQVSFCDPDAPFASLSADDDAAANTDADTELTITDTARSTATFTRTPASGSTVTASTPTTARFGIRGRVPGGATFRAFLDNAGGTAGTFQAGELNVQGSTSFTAGGTNTDQNTSGGNAAQDAVQSITDTSRNNTTFTAGQTATFTVQVRNAAGDPVSGVTVSGRVVSGPNGPRTASSTTDTDTQATPVTFSGVTNNNGEIVGSFTPRESRGAGTDSIQVFVNQTSGSTSGPDAGEPTLTISRTIAPAPTTVQAEARNITLTPERVTTVSGQSTVFTAVVTGVNGQPVQGINVVFTEEGPGRFSNGTSTITVATDSTGTARATTTSVAGENGTQVIIASIPSTGNRTQEAATSTQAAGNSSDSSTQTFLASSPSASPSTSPSATPTTSTSPSPSPSASNPTPTAPGSMAPQRLRITVSPNVITPGIQSVVRVSGTPGTDVELLAYSRPSTEFVVVRRGTIDASGVIEFRVTPGTNTRLFARVAGSTTSDSPSVVINVRTALSLSVVRNGPRNYTFQGRILPRRAGQLITLYRVTDDGREILTAQLRTDSSGTYRINRRFTGSGTFGFLTRTGQTLTNAAGVSNNGAARPTAIF